MLYVPDVMATTVEVVSGSALVRVYANLKRWSGNTLRNSDRSIALGPRTMGIVPWLSTIDQRVSNWTTLVGMTVSVLRPTRPSSRDPCRLPVLGGGDSTDSVRHVLAA